MEEAIGILRKYRDILQVLHWNSGKEYGKHLLFEKMIKDLDPLIDRFVEIFMGTEGTTFIDNNNITCSLEYTGDLTAFIQAAKGEFVSYLINNKTQQNVVDDIIEMFDRHLYLI